MGPRCVIYPILSYPWYARWRITHHQQNLSYWPSNLTCLLFSSIELAGHEIRAYGCSTVRASWGLVEDRFISNCYTVQLLRVCVKAFWHIHSNYGLPLRPHVIPRGFQPKDGNPLPCSGDLFWEIMAIWISGTSPLSQLGSGAEFYVS